MSAKPEKLLRAESLIGNFLRYGVLLCLAVIGAGLAMRLAGGAGNAAFLEALTHGRAAFAEPKVAADRVISLGLMMLISLPVLRVALTTLIFLLEKDWAFFVITLVVLTVLLSGIMLGHVL